MELGHPIRTRLDPEDHRRIKAWCKDNDITLYRFLRRAARELAVRLGIVEPRQ